jgi:D-sedoheptulose 7-phosphate isomerase
LAAIAGSRQDSIAEHFRRSCETLDQTASDGAMMQAMIRATEAMATALHTGNKILVAGNGGSAAVAQHIGGEFLSRLNFDRTRCRPLRWPRIPLS